MNLEMEGKSRMLDVHPRFYFPTGHVSIARTGNFTMAKKPAVVASSRSQVVQSPTQSAALSLSRLSTASHDLWKSYVHNTPNSLFIIDAFLVFLVYVGG